MDDKNRENHFSLSNEDDTDTAASPTAMEDAREKMKINLEHISDSIAKNLHYTYELAETIRPALERFAKMTQELSVAMRPILEITQQTVQSVTKAIACFQIPTITEERKQELIASYKKWGEYGWTLNLNTPFDCFDELPASIEAANATMIPLCSKHEMEQLFEELRAQHIKKEDLEAAILCYENRQYKACSLLLFGIIDAKLIRKQTRGKKYRPSGSKAAKRLREQFENGNNEEMLFTMLHCVNLFACLETLFAAADDFKIEPSTINRNFVSHGMTHRPVRQRDCIQLFLALYNLVLFVEDAP